MRFQPCPSQPCHLHQWQSLPCSPAPPVMAMLPGQSCCPFTRSHANTPKLASLQLDECPCVGLDVVDATHYPPSLGMATGILHCCGLCPSLDGAQGLFVLQWGFVSHFISTEGRGHLTRIDMWPEWCRG
mmetsp:Transcript_128680/g.222309  ORF Transcript_128680/g.222309 Transcript_128680/m.222309 type:complete len:129 (-) Transcript_128680:397-783(-)